MTMAGRPNRFSSFGMSGSSADNTQPIGSSFNNPRWPSNDIWGSKIIGGSLSANRDATGSRGSDETSPTGPSGSAQLNPSSEAVPWSSQGVIWNSSAPSAHKPSASGNVSPTRIRDMHDMANNSQFFARPSLGGQNGSAFTSRQKPTGNMDGTAPSTKYPTYGDSTADAAEPSGLYGGMNTSSVYRRNSSESPYAPFNAHRQGSITRQSEAESNLAPSHFGDYSFKPNTAGHGPFHNQRPSVPNHSISFPTEGSNRSRMPAFNSEVSDKKFNDALQQLSLEETSAPSLNGYVTNGITNPASQPFQFNPNSSPWSFDPMSGPRGYGLPDNFMDPSSGTYYNPKKALGGGSPAGSVFRPNLNSPRTFGSTPNPRAEPWSKPNTRDPRALHEVDRQPHVSPQYLPQQPSPYYSSQYYNPDMSQYSNPYDQFSQNPHFRPGVQLYPYVPAPVHVPIRPSKDVDPGKGVRSVLLEEFRGNGKSKRYELKDIYDHVVEFSGDQHGSRFIQERLTTANSDEKDQVFREVEPNAIQLMKDVFGNYVIQKFFEHGNQVQKKILATMMKGKVAELSTQMYACRVVQKALEHVLVEQQAEIVEELKQKLMYIVKDSNGNHVVQKIIQMFPNQCIPAVMDVFHGQVDQLAAHNYGCRVIQRILECGSDAEKSSTMAEIHTHANFLITDTFGNYVAQHIIEHGEPEDRDKMIELVTKNVATFSKHKFASNVVEQCIEFGTPEQRKAIQAQLCVVNSDGSSPLPFVIKDQFGNYVIQKMLNFLDGPEWEAFVKDVNASCLNIKKWGGSNGGGNGTKQIVAIDRLINEIIQERATNGTNPRPTVTTTIPSLPGGQGLQGDAASTGPTPSLTTEQSSPQSIGPPSTNADNIEDSVTGKAEPPVNGQSAPIAQVNGV